jgi:hypothetical protein
MEMATIHVEVMKDLLYRWMALTELINEETAYQMKNSLKEQIEKGNFSNQAEYDFYKMAMRYLSAAQNPCDEGCNVCGGDFSRNKKFDREK